MMNQNLSNSTEQPQNSSALAENLQKPETFKLLIQKRDEYIETFRSQKIKAHLESKRLTAVKAPSHQERLSLQTFIAEWEKRTYILTAELLDELVVSLNSPNLYKQYFGVIGIRKLLAAENPPIQPFIDAGVVPRLVEFVGREEEPQLQAEAAWILSNLSSGTTKQTQKIIENRAIPALLKLLKSPHHDVRFKALRPLGNFAGDNASFRDMILQRGAIAPLVEILNKAISEGDQYMVRDANWTLTNLCRTKPLPPFEEIKEVIPVVARVIMNQEDPEILKDAVLCMSYLSEGEDQERIQRVIDTGVVPCIVKLMDKNDVSVLVGCLRTIGKICLGNNQQVDMVLNIPGIREKLFSLQECKKKAVRKEAAVVIKNITASAPEYILRNPEYLDRLIFAGILDLPEIKEEMAVALNNIIIGIADKEQMRVLLGNKGVFDFLKKLLEEEKEVSLQKIALTGIWMIWTLKEERAPEGFTKAFCRALLEEHEILPVLEDLLKSPNSSIKDATEKILGNDENVEK